MEFFLQLTPGGVEVGGRQAGAGPSATRLAAAKHSFLQLLGKSSRRLPEPAFKKLHHRFRKHQLSVAVDHFLGSQVVGDHEQGHVADDFRSRRHLDNVAEHAIDFRVHPADFRPATAETERLGLLMEVGVLSAGHFMTIDVRAAGLLAALEGPVIAANRLPVVGRGLKRII